MISLSSQIQAILDALGIHLDAQSFSNLLAQLRVDRLSWTAKMALAVALGVFAQWLRKRSEERRAAAVAAAGAV